MSDNILKQLYKNSEEVSKDIKSMDTTLGKILKLQKEQDKFEKKKDKEETTAKKRATAAEKRKKADWQGFKGIVKMKKKEKDDEKKSLFDMLLGGIGGAIQNIVGTLTSVVGGIGTAITSALAGLGLGAMISGALTALAPVLIGALATAAVAAVMNPEVQKWLDKHIGDKMSQLGLGNWFRSKRESEQGLTAAEAQSIADGTLKRRGESSQATDTDRSRLQAARSISHLRSKMAQLEDHMTRYEQMIQNHNQQIISAEEKGDTQTADYAKSEIKKYEKLLNDHEAEYRSHQSKIQDLIIKNSLEKEYQEVGWVKRQVGGHINVPGSGEGDKVPMLLPQGSFVLNKMASMHFQTGGLVPTLLEPGEKVFMPGDWDDTISTLNQMIPRFQTGGVVEHLHGDPHRSGYDHHGHGRQDNAHDHFAFSSKEMRLQVQQALAAGQGPSGRKWQIGSTTGGKHAENSYHYSGQAFDIPWSQFGSGPINQRDYEQSRQLAKDVEHLVKEFGGTVGDIQQDAQGNLQAAARQTLGATDDMLGGALSGIGDTFNGLFAGFEAFSSGFMSGLRGIFGEGNPLIGLFPGLAGGGGGIHGLTDTLGGMLGLSGFDSNSNQSSSTPPMGPGVATGSANETALLNAIADAEGTSKYANGGYNTHFGGGQTQDLSQHPQKVVRKGGYRSDAFGRYQFMSPTWNEWSGGRDMSPANQDAVALELVRKKKGVDISDGLSLQEIYRLGGEWASIEGGPNMVKGGSYGSQAKYSAEQFMEMYRRHGGAVQKQRGGVVGRRSSELLDRMRKAQGQHNQSIQMSVKPIVVYEDAPPVEVSTMADVAFMPPSLPDGPGSAMASDYFYNLSLGAQ